MQRFWSNDRLRPYLLAVVPARHRCGRDPAGDHPALRRQGDAALIPLPYRILGAAVLAAVLALTCYVGGRRSKQADLDALRRSYELAAAQSQAARKERERVWEQAMTQAGRQYDERAKVADRSFDNSLDRLRSAYASSAQLRVPAGTAGQCDRAGEPTAADLLRQGETLAAIARDADRDRAALISCVQAWPR